MLRSDPTVPTAVAHPAAATTASREHARVAISSRWAHALAVASGVLYFLAFPGIDIWPLAFVALVPLIVALRGQTTRRATTIAWTAGFTMTMLGFYWLLGMLRVFAEMPTPVCALLMALVCAFQAGRLALCGWLYGRAATRGWPAAVAFVLAFAASELVFPLILPWHFGATLHRVPLLFQTAELGGPILVGLVLVCVNLGIAEVVLARRERRPLDIRPVAAGGIAIAAAIGYGALRLPAVEAAMRAAPTLKIGIAQGNMPLLDRSPAIEVHKRLTGNLRDRGADLVVWSELAAGKSYWDISHQQDVPNAITHDLGVPTIVGVTLYREDRGQPAFTNTALLADASGAIVGRYDKHYLLAFGEYLPLGETFPSIYKLSPNSGRYTRGRTLTPLPFGEHRITALICYEDILPGFVNQAVAAADPDLLVDLTNDAWFGDTTEPWIHLAMSKLRAVEHRRFLVRATNSGVSAIVDAAGRLTMSGGTFHEEALLGEARFMRARTPVEIVGELPWYAVTLLIALMAFVRRPRRPARDAR